MTASRSGWRYTATAATGLLALVVGSLTAVGLATSASATGPVGHTGLVPDSVRLDTVRIESGEISDIEVVGNKAYIAGSFTSIRNATGTAVDQPYIAAFNIDTGLLDTTFRPVVPSAVEAVEASPNGSALYITGAFNTVNGVTKRKLAKINPTTGATDTAFTANLGARGTALAVTNNWVYVGGQFTTVNSSNRSALAAVNPTTGAVDTGFNLPITQGIGSGGVLKVSQLKLTSNNATLVVAHTGRLVAGQQRVALAQIDTAGKSLKAWNTNLFADYLPVTGGVVRVTNFDISPDNSYLVTVSGGGGDRPPVSDTAVAFPMNGGANPSDVEEKWVSRLFDSVYGVAITEKAVYLGGHFRYMEAPTANQPWPGLDTQNYGWGESLGAGVLGPTQVVRRDMLGAVDPATGTALEWNPTAEAALGHSHLEATPRGLFVGMDSSVIGAQAIGRFGFFDFNNIPPPSAAETLIDYPYDGALGSAGPLTFEGRAQTTSTVSQVQLQITNTLGGAYLQDNLTTWSSTFNTINATIDSPASASSEWHLDVANFPAGSFRVQARTIAGDGSRDATWASKRFETSVVDNPAPKTTLTQPAAQQPVTTSTFLIAGVSNDDEGVVNVALQIRDTDTNLYLQDDGTFAGQSNTFSAELLTPNQPQTNWEYEVTLPDGQYNLTAVATDNEGQVEHEGLGRRLTVAATGTNVAPAVTLGSVVTGTVFAPNTPLTLSGVATDDGSVVAVEVSIRNNATTQGIQIDGSYGPVPAYYKVTPANTNAQTVNYSWTTPPLPVGVYTIRVRATDNTETRTPATAVPPSTIVQPNVTVTMGVAGDALPDTTLSFTGTDQTRETLSLPITGTATDNLGVASVKMAVFNSTTREYLTHPTSGATSLTYTLMDLPVTSPGATSTTFSQTFTLPDPGNYRITAVAVDTAGQMDANSTGAGATYLIFPGDTDPTLVAALQTPVNGNTYTNTIPIGGRAEDDNGITRVSLTVQNTGTGQYLRIDGSMGASQTLSAYLTNPGGPGSNFSYTTPTLAPGSYLVTVYPTDNNGQVLVQPYTATVTVVAG
ncbi:MAG TPA: Ig-like domain-containing protein [Kineosporiaceae bacterium]|nr:Ig-like domain-containing protein [Kineosporiaceae bacterium]